MSVAIEASLKNCLGAWPVACIRRQEAGDEPHEAAAVLVRPSALVVVRINSALHAFPTENRPRVGEEMLPVTKKADDGAQGPHIGRSGIMFIHLKCIHIKQGSISASLENKISRTYP